jgi:hypothetical protein
MIAQRLGDFKKIMAGWQRKSSFSALKKGAGKSCREMLPLSGGGDILP